MVGLCRCAGWRANRPLLLENPALLGRSCLARAPRAHLRLIRSRLFRCLYRQARRSPEAAASVSRTYVPLSCISSQPFDIARSRPALYSAGRPGWRIASPPAYPVELFLLDDPAPMAHDFAFNSGYIGSAQEAIESHVFSAEVCDDNVFRSCVRVRLLCRKRPDHPHEHVCSSVLFPDFGRG